MMAMTDPIFVFDLHRDRILVFSTLVVLSTMLTGASMNMLNFRPLHSRPSYIRFCYSRKLKKMHKLKCAYIPYIRNDFIYYTVPYITFRTRVITDMLLAMIITVGIKNPRTIRDQLQVRTIGSESDQLEQQLKMNQFDVLILMI